MTVSKPVQPESPTDPGREAARAAAKRIDRINNWLCVGGALPPAEFSRFKEAGITHIVDLREEAPVAADNQRLQELDITRRHVPVPDRGPPSTEQLRAVADWLGARDQGVSLYVYCKGGFGRAATMAVGLLILDGAALDEAVDQVRRARPEMRLNAEQLVWLQQVEEQCLRLSAKD